MSKRAAVIVSVSASLVLVATFIAWAYWPVAFALPTRASSECCENHRPALLKQ
jgi:hypothetical protein